MEKIEKGAYTLYVLRSARGCLSYIVASNKTREALVIDPSAEVGDEYLRAITDEKLTLKYVVDTHTHADHVSAHTALTSATGARYVMYQSAPSASVDVRVQEGDDIAIGDVWLRVLYTPGHASDMMTLVLPDAVFTADTLLIGGTGRTDLHRDASSGAEYDSIFQKILPLGDDVAIYPGHDYEGRTASTIGEEKRANPRLQLSREEFVRIMDAHHPALPELLEESVRKNSE